MSAWRNIQTITWRELSSLFSSPVAYVFVAIFLLLSGFFTFMIGGFFQLGQASLNRTFFEFVPWLWLALVPAIGMRLWSEEKRSGTIELLLTNPIQPWHAIVGKFLASWLVLFIALLLTFPLVLTILFLGQPELGVVFSGYLGSFLVAGAFLSVSSMTSAMSRNQVVSFIIAVVICLFFILAGFSPVTEFFRAFAPEYQPLIDFIAGFSVMTHYANFQRGLIDFRDVFYFLSVIAFSLFATSILIRSQRQ